MAAIMTLKCGDIQGESEVDGHKGEIDVLSFHFGDTQSGIMHSATGGGAGMANVHDLWITKWVDLATPALLEASSNGTYIPEAVLTVGRAEGDAPVEYLKITMKECLIASVSSGRSGSGDRSNEDVTINFANVTVDYNS
jgi:type VI secretion system secreted protein Hcp